MSRILEYLVDVSRITRGKLELRLTATDLVPVVQSAIETSLPLTELEQPAATDSRFAGGADLAGLRRGAFIPSGGQSFE